MGTEGRLRQPVCLSLVSLPSPSCPSISARPSLRPSLRHSVPLSTVSAPTANGDNGDNGRRSAADCTIEQRREGSAKSFKLYAQGGNNDYNRVSCTNMVNMHLHSSP